MTPENYSNQLIRLLENSITDFNNQLPAVEKELYKTILITLKELEIKNGKIVNNVANLNKIARIRSALEKSILNDKWLSSVKGLLQAFQSIEKLQNLYFNTLDPKFQSNTLLKTITAGAIDTTLQMLTEDGIQAGVISKIHQILIDNIHSQVSFADMVEDMRKFLIGDENKEGVLQSYASKFVTDALNQYSATYTQAVAQDLGFEWFMYTGSLLETSRDFCIKMVEKKYIHVSEFPTVLKGHFASGDIKIYPKTNLPYGLFDNTKPESLPVKRGGHRCGHQLTPVHAAVVPLTIRESLRIAA